ncbi:hypothetical protein EVAR_50927_1 [Eumeta japonica]|uniref:Amino acid transporter transmembrane domain-containing protein n=1 Tax=Eumeta variegata TaxID=151549 RepID=A0A4C1Y2H4_EUMVA|nr:hypothetical protein EVAR_50927_1 [Eumeta japonica]
MAYFNLLRTLFGAGMLGIPLAISQAGMLFGTVMNLATGVIMVYAHFNLKSVALMTFCHEGHLPTVSRLLTVVVQDRWIAAPVAWSMHPYYGPEMMSKK